jgi:AbrB family looped-hinge helix DNA binding protein
MHTGFSRNHAATTHPALEPRAMEATVAERGQITLPKAVRDALGLVKGTQLKVELDGSRIILRKNVDDAVSRLRGRFKLPQGVTTDDVMRELRGRAPGDPVDL